MIVQNVHNNLDINVEVATTAPLIAVAVTVTFTTKNETQEVLLSAKITMVGHFEKVGDPALGEETFANVNAPAIIFPIHP